MWRVENGQLIGTRVVKTTKMLRYYVEHSKEFAIRASMDNPDAKEVQRVGALMAKDPSPERVGEMAAAIDRYLCHLLN